MATCEEAMEMLQLHVDGGQGSAGSCGRFIEQERGGPL